MAQDHLDSRDHDAAIVELSRVQPIEAEVIVARLRAAGIAAIVGADSVYPSLPVADGVPVLVAAADLQRARELIEGDDQTA